MKRGDFLKALAALPFAPSVLERLGQKNLVDEPLQPWAGPCPSVSAADGSWVVEFAGATFTLDIPGSMPTAATAPFVCRMGVDHLDSGWKRLWVTRGAKTYVAFVKRNAGGHENITAWRPSVTPAEPFRWNDPTPAWWPRRIR